MKVILSLVILVGLLFLVAGCAPGPNPLEDIPREDSRSVSGLFSGFWHGLICMFSFIASWFTHEVSMYEVRNSGVLYDFGFYVGIFVWIFVIRSIFD